MNVVAVCSKAQHTAPMFQGVLTLLTRALKGDARLRRAHAFRIGSTVLIFLFLIVAHVTSGGVGAPGLRFFELISWLNLALITLAGASFFATAITEEKEEGTLGLLQLAGVSTLGLLLGKSTARLIAALLVFIAQLPFAMLAISLGGVTARQIIAVDVALAAYMVMLANVALLSSVISRRSGMACALMILFLLMLLPGVHFGDHSVDTLVRDRYLEADAPFVVAADTCFGYFQNISIVTRIGNILQVEPDRSLFGTQVMFHLIVAAIAFGLSWVTFDRFTRYADVSTPARGILPKVNSRLAVFIERPWKWPLVWKDYHFLTGGHTLALAKLAGYAAMLVAMYRYDDMLDRLTGLSFSKLSMQLMFVLLGCELCLYASRLFHEEMKWGTLPSLLMLPQSVVSLAAGKVAGCLLGLIPGVISLCGLAIWLNHHGQFPRIMLDAPDVWMILMQFLVLLHLTVLCSLLVKWGGLALAIGIQLILNALLSLPMSVVFAGLTESYLTDEVTIAPIIYVGCLISVVLQFLIGLRLRQLAGA